MKTHTNKTQENKSPSVYKGEAHPQGSHEATFQLTDNRSETVVQRKLQKIADSYTSQEQIIQKKENNTGLPDNLKAGIESLSGYSMDDVKVHRNSDKPGQLQAHAYAQGTDIHLGPGQEKHLPHEAWHVVQQAQGRVRPTMQLKRGVEINDDHALEHEADIMGAKAITEQFNISPISEELGKIGVPIQRKVGFEIETEQIDIEAPVNAVKGTRVMDGDGWELVLEGSNNPWIAEYVTAPYDEYKQSKKLVNVVKDATVHAKNPEGKVYDSFTRKGKASTGNMQVTGGIKLNKLLQMLQVFAAGLPYGDTTLIAHPENELGQTYDAVVNLQGQPSTSYLGLVAMVANYIIDLHNPDNSPFGTAKMNLNVLGRSHFAGYWKLIKDRPKINKFWLDIMTVVIARNQYVNIDDPLVPLASRNVNFGEKAATRTADTPSMSIRTWLSNVYYSAQTGPELEVTWNDDNKGNELVGPKKKQAEGVIVELRNFGAGNVSVNIWYAYAHKILEAFRMLNNSDN